MASLTDSSQTAIGGQEPPAPGTQVMRQVLTALKEGRTNDAVRAFVDALHHNLLPKGPDLTPWLLSTIGKEDTIRLTTAFVHFPCFYCKSGLDRCDNCDGRGARPESPFCETCAGSGQSRCEFCDGTGLATYSFIPTELWLPVLIERNHVATEQLKRIAAHPIPKPAEPHAEQRLLDSIINVNKLLGVLENGVIAARELPPYETHHDAVRHALDHAHKTASDAVLHLRRLLEYLAATLRRLAKSHPPDSAEAQFDSARADFYQSLARSSDFAGTGLHHPFLNLK